MDGHRLKVIDEAGVNLALTRLDGRAPAGARAVGSMPCNYGPNVTRLGALGTTGREALMTVDGATDGAVCRAFVAHSLGPTLQAGAVVVRDHLRAHKVAGIAAAITECGARLISRPPYAPDLSPIDQCWAKLKPCLRRIGARTREALEAAIASAMEGITAAEALAWFAPWGYMAS